MLTVKEAAERLKLHPNWVRQLCARGVFPGARKLGGPGPGRREWRIPSSDLDNYMGERP